MSKFYKTLKPFSACVVMLAAATVNGLAEDYTPDFSEDGMYFQIISPAEKTVRVVPVPDSQRYTGDGIVPRRVSYQDTDYTVVEIGDYAFDASEMTSTSLPSTIRRIGKYAYRNCKNLTSVSIPGSSENTGNWAFQGCTSLTDITIEDGVSVVDAGSFREVGARTISLPQSVSVIESDAFSFSKSLESLVIPDKVETIGNGALSYCDALRSITFGRSMRTLPVAWIEGDYALEEFNVVEGNEHFASSDGVLYSSDMTRLVQCPVKKTSLEIPDGVVEIADWGLDHCWNLKTVDFGKTLRKIGSSGLKLCNELEEAVLPETIEELGNYAFMQCDNLKRVVLGSSLKSLGSSVFYKDKLIEEIVCKAPVPPVAEANEFWNTTRRRNACE